MAYENQNRIQTQDQTNSARSSTAVFYDGVFYGQVPVDLLRDPKIKLQAKGIYALLHSYSQPKNLIAKPQTFVSQVTLADNVGLSRVQLSKWVKMLEDSGWLTIKRRGLGKSNYYILHAQKKKKR